MKKIIVAVLSLITSSIILSFGMTRIMKQSRTVTVRGLCEREVDADMAVWRLAFSLGSNDLTDLKKEITDKTQTALQYLKDNGLEEEDYSILAPEVTDATINMYMDSSRRTYDYIAKQVILIRSSKTDCVKNASSHTLELIGKGVSVSSDWNTNISYEFNGLNEIKPQMIASATENARLCAEQFARDSHSKVGKIMSATQGLFSIEDAAVGLENKKKIRVVTTVVYSLAD